MSNVLDQINAAHREISTYPVATGEGRSLLLRRTYDASADDVWNACTDPARISRWLAPVTGDLRLGGAFQVEGRASGRSCAVTSLVCSRSRGSTGRDR
ncbi:SRPBCC domain-containing protein [Streptomyces sp. M10(2022)]